jgi:hypothetical protein
MGIDRMRPCRIKSRVHDNVRRAGVDEENQILGISNIETSEPEVL